MSNSTKKSTLRTPTPHGFVHRAPRLLLAGLLLTGPAPSAVPQQASLRKAPHETLSLEAVASAEASIEHLRRVMDRYHTQFGVYEDVSSAGNHFHVWAKTASHLDAVEMNGSSTDNPHSGATAIRCEFMNVLFPNWGGFYLMNGVLQSGATVPIPNWGTFPDAGIDLTGATSLRFWARGETGGEIVEFFMGGVGWPSAPYKDSSPKTAVKLTLSTSWTEYEIEVSALDLSYLLGGFGWVANDFDNPTGAVFWIDDISYKLSAAAQEARLSQPRLLRSFVTAAVQDQPPPVGIFDLQFRNAAVTYDNALAILAFLAHGSAKSLERAQLIGDAVLYAIANDRTYTDGRLRDIYAAGDIALPPGWIVNGKSATVPIPGYYDEEQALFFENGQHEIRTGNQAWAMLALLALYEATSDSAYLDATLDLGAFIQTVRQESGTYQGFRGGYEDPESANATAVEWASIEHNLDVLAVFSTLHATTADPQWLADAQHARSFVEAMWDPVLGCYRAGTSDPETRNSEPFQIVEDAHSWTVLALADALSLHPETLLCAETHHALTDSGFDGFDFNNDKDGVWLEGSAHMALAYLKVEEIAKANELRAMLRAAQSTPPYGDGLGIAATIAEAVSTGFGDTHFFRRLHIATASWNVFAQLAFNPFYAESLVPDLTVILDGSGSGTVISSPAGIDCGSDCSETFDFGDVVSLTPTEDSGSIFGGWSGHPDCADGLLDMGGDRECVATFDLRSFELQVQLTGAGAGTVTSSPAGIDCGATCSQSYEFGTLVTLTAMPDPDSGFVGWSGDADCEDGSVTISGDLTCVADFCLRHLVIGSDSVDETRKFLACETVTLGPGLTLVYPARVLVCAGRAVIFVPDVSIGPGVELEVRIDSGLEPREP